jgi:hypothetical protein
MDEKKQINPEFVKDFVGSAHGNLACVVELLEEEPHLLNAAWDWGGGDWETALGAAAHMGRQDIAQALLDRGARIDLFAAAMMGKLAIVQSVVEDDPEVIHRLGPHGIPLIDHAKAGGAEAAAVVDYLNSLNKGSPARIRTGFGRVGKSRAKR